MLHNIDMRKEGYIGRQLLYISSTFVEVGSQCAYKNNASTLPSQKYTRPLQHDPEQHLAASSQ